MDLEPLIDTRISGNPFHTNISNPDTASFSVEAEQILDLMKDNQGRLYAQIEFLDFEDTLNKINRFSSHQLQSPCLACELEEFCNCPPV